jgi:hypothetical protein
MLAKIGFEGGWGKGFGGVGAGRGKAIVNC